MSRPPRILTGLPANTKATGGARSDFKVNHFDRQIQIKGQRVWWSRAGLCPCEGNSQTKQVDPTCTLCRGRGWTYFLPDAGIVAEGVDSAGNAVELSEAGDAVGIPALILGVSNDPQVFEKFGQWLIGMAKATTQSANRLNYRDRLQARDALMEYSQLIDASGGTEIGVTGMRSTAGLWTPVAQVNLLRSLSTVYVDGEDFEVSPTGTISWLTTPPTSETKLTLHASFHPCWIVLESPYPARSTYVAAKRGTKSKAEEFSQLPPHAMVKLDFMMDS